jgi:tRNA(His) 5'-end guanylyltransferase
MNIDERMKEYEFLYRQKLLPLTPVIVRLDGRAFHTFCKKLRRPFDRRFHDLMVKTTEHLVKESHAKIGYTQSDEISLLLFSDRWESQIYFNGNVNKIISTLAATASVFFNKNLKDYLPEKADREMPTFDARVCNYPVEDVASYFIWRERDATRNSILNCGLTYFGHSALRNLNTKQIQEMLLQDKQINWNDFPYDQKRGTYIQQKKVCRKMTVEEMETLPPKHNARKNPDLEIERLVLVIKEIPPLTKVTNRTEFLLFGEEPVTD